ncbi:hypothetical protein BH24BAC1_BH24BAC1_38270 [soil metagenome]
MSRWKIIINKLNKIKLTLIYQTYYLLLAFPTLSIPGFYLAQLFGS